MATIETFSAYGMYLYSQSDRKQRRGANKYLLERLSHPDEGSEISRSIGLFKYVFRLPGIGPLLLRPRLWYDVSVGKDVLFLNYEENIIGHTAFHTHRDDRSVHIFSVEVAESFRRQRLGKLMVDNIIDKAIAENRNVRVGGGNNDAVNWIYREMAKRSDVEDGGDNWIFRLN